MLILNKKQMDKWMRPPAKAGDTPSQLTGSLRYSGLRVCADNLLEPGQALVGGPTVPPIMVWEHKVPCIHTTAGCVGKASWFCPFSNQIKPGPHFTAGYTGEGVGCRRISQKKPKPKNQPDWDLNPGLLHHSPVT